MKTVLTVLTMILVTVVYAQEKYIIEGTIEGNDQSMIKVIDDYYNPGGKTLSEANIKNGSFKLEGIYYGKPEVKYLKFGSKSIVPIFLEKGTIKIKIVKDRILQDDEYATVYQPFVSGTKNNDILAEFITQKLAIENSEKFKTYTSTAKALDEAYKKNASPDEIEKLSKVVQEEYPKFDEAILELKKEFALKYKEEIAAIYLFAIEGEGITSTSYTKKERETFKDLFKKYNSDHTYYQQLENKLRIFENVGIGATPPDFTLLNEKDEPIKLSDYRGKYVFLDFWAYWCVPCVETFPHLKKLQNKYKDKGFQILGISSDPTRSAWLKALKKYQNPWPQIIETAEMNSPQQISTQYGVEYLPTTYLLDPDGKVIATNLTEDQLDKKLQEIYGNK